MANTLKFGNGEWATKEGSTLAYNDENGNFKPLPFDFSRDSGATRVNKEGLIEVVGNNEPRIDFKDDSKGALLLEPTRSNLVTYSQDFSSGWSLDDATVSINSGISPDGTLNATLLKGNTNSSRHNLVISAQANNTGTFSIFVKAKELKYVQIASANTTEQYVNFDLINGVIGTVGSSFSNAKIEDYGNGWYRCIVVSANQFNGFYFSLVNGLNATWLESWIMPNNTDGLYIWGAQLEQGSYATSYIPTSGQANGVTRVADSSSQTLPSSVFNSYPFSVFAEVDVVDTSSGYAFSLLNKASSNNYFTIEYYSNKWHIVARPSGSTITRSSLEILTKGTHKLVGVYTDTNLKLYLNGSLIASGSNTQSFNSNVDSLLLGQLRISGDTNSRNTIRQTYLYNNELTDAEAIALTS